MYIMKKVIKTIYINWSTENVSEFMPYRQTKYNFEAFIKK